MKNWKIPVIWQEAGTIEVVADTLVEAIKIANDVDGVIPLPDDGYYLEGSWIVATEDVEFLRQYYNGGQED